MSEQIFADLEAAAEIIMAPPNIVTNEQRHAAEAVFLNFRKTKNPYNICREILEKSKNDYVLFEAAEVIKCAIIREWSFLLDTDRVSLRQYLFQYIINRELAQFVRERLLQVIAIMVKRASVDDSGRERGNILQEVENLVVNAEPSKKILGCQIITNLMQEYATTVRSTDVGLPWEVHFKAKKNFESTDLKRIFQFCIYLLSEIVKNDLPYPENVLHLIGQLLRIAENILTWGYISPLLTKRLVGIFETVYTSDHASALKLSTNWSDIMFDPNFLPLMFQIYWKVRDNGELAHHSISCLVQLASLSGAIFSKEQDKMKYLHSYLMTFFNLISNVTIKNKESLGISNMVRKLVTFFIDEIVKLPPHMQDTLLDEFARLTCNFCDGATMEEAQGDEDKYFLDAFDTMLEAWTTVLQEYTEGKTNTLDRNLHECAARIFNKYVQCHLAPPDGCRQNPNDEIEEIEDNEDNDRTRFKDQLQTIGLFGRVIPSHSLPLLYKLLEIRIEKLTNHLNAIQSRAMNISEAAYMENLFEDIHWIVLIAGHVLCMDSEGETPLIPSEIMRYSIDQCNNQKQSSIEATINAFVAIGNKGSAIDLDRCDHIVRIVYNVLKLCTVEEYAVSIKLAHFLSPEVGCTLMWFLKRWCLLYLLPVENYYAEISPTLISALGKDTDCSKLVVSYILTKIQSNMFHFKNDPVLLRDTVDLFCDIVCVKQKSIHIVKTESMLNLVNYYHNIEPSSLPTNILRGLCKGFVLAGVVLSNTNETHTYYDMILTPMQTKFKSIISQENFSRTCHSWDNQRVLVDLFESLIGVAKGTLMSSVELLFPFLLPILSELPVLIQLYTNYQVIIQLILELYGQCAKYMLCYLSPADSKMFYETSSAAIEMYAKCNRNRLTSEQFAEESSLQDLSLVLDLLTFILSKDCIDLCATTNVNDEVQIVASEVSLIGLNFILPLMTIDLLKYPKLCAQYYRLLVLVNDIYPEKICQLPHEMLTTLLKSIELGLTCFGSDISQTSLDFIQGMAFYVFRNKLEKTTIGEMLRPFLEIVMDVTLTHQINSDLMNIAGTCLYTLICCYQENYKQLVERLIQLQTDPLIAERLSMAFYNLTLHIELDCKRMSKLSFRDRFDKFVANVHGFLLIK